MNPTYHHALAPGTHIESYEIHNVLGVGGFGVTYKAYDHTLQRDVALKEYLPTGLAVRTPDGTTVTPKSENDVESYEYGLMRFLDEARTLAKFREPNIVRVLGYMEAHGTAYFVMDYEDGESLSARLKKVGTLDENNVRAVMIPMLSGLRAVHAQKFLHRDIKPANIFLRRNGSPVLLDFGAARLALGEQSRAMTGMVTPGYAPFEQYFSRGKQGPWTDIYGIGATIYHCVTGIAPVASTDRVAAIQDGEPDPIGDVTRLSTKSHGEPFLQTVRWMLEPNAKDRPQTIEQVLEALGIKVETDLQRGATLEEAYPDTVKLDHMKDTGVSWEAEVLKTVEANLEQHIGPLSRALVRKAAQKTSNVDELTEMLARFIPSQQDKTVFLARTQIVRSTESVKNAGEQEPAGVDEVTLRTAEQTLATYVGPMAKILVKKAARRTKDLEDFCRTLERELPDDKQRRAFRRALEKGAQSGRR
ncbi:MAG: serine/threonine-protein kinase [Acidiferrobacterales bacterium]